MWLAIQCIGYLLKTMSLLLPRQKRPPELIRSVSYPQNRHRSSPALQRRNVAPPKRRGAQATIVLVLVGILAMVFVGSWNKHDAKSQSDSQVAGVQTREPEPKQLDFTAMSAAINQTVQTTSSMDIGVSVIDIKTGQALNYGEQSPFEAASTSKLLTAIAFLSDVEGGKDNLSEPVGNRTAKAALEALIVDSDNDAWDDFNNHIMTHVELAAYADKIGFEGYDPDKNTVTPASLARLLNNLYQQRLLNQEHTDLLLSYMQRAKEVDYITSIVPSGTKIYHKPGYLIDRVHDATVIDNGTRPYVLVIFTKSHTKSYDTTSGTSVFQDIARATFAAFPS